MRELLQSPGVRLGSLLLVAAAVRLAFFTGFAYGDDVFYISAATALVEGQGWRRCRCIGTRAWG